MATKLDMLFAAKAVSKEINNRVGGPGDRGQGGDARGVPVFLASSRFEAERMVETDDAAAA